MKTVIRITEYREGARSRINTTPNFSTVLFEKLRESSGFKGARL
jgi:hypothetical protein